MEITPSRSDELTEATTVANRLRALAMPHGNWTDYLASTLDETDDMMAYATFCSRLGDMREARIQLTADSPRGSLKLAWDDTKDVLSAHSLRHGYQFGMLVNDELMALSGDTQRYALDRLTPHINAIFDDILTTSGSSDDLMWTFRLFGDNLYLNTLAHPDHLDYHALNNRPDPIKPIIEDICGELYPAPDDIGDFPGYERQDIDTQNFKHGFAIARRAYNSYLSETR